eukprot:TRINITY_DN47349_c0_g1_i1.p2 TRINITY_DN47349_c0_g1~~TRINITY_DN47349_c0_g1_i1.p2  ORF type:complete len:268 (+),score=71.14 TRINITY_DN47349_c0_g1_i1:172-975(+)
MAVIISFDVDGTLVRSTNPRSNKVHKDAFAYAAEMVFPREVEKGHSIDELPNHHGSTDGIILCQFCEMFGRVPFEEAKAQVPEMMRLMADYFDKNKASVTSDEGLQIIPGIPAAMEHLVKSGCCKVGLVTGNVEAIAWGKMKSVGLEVGTHFSEPAFGGFGSCVATSGTDEDAKVRDRGEQIKLAMQRGKEAFGSAPADIRCFHIGDAPPDVSAAAYAGVTPIGVTTGKFTEEELLAACPSAIILPSLEDLPRFLRVLGLGEGAEAQ